VSTYFAKVFSTQGIFSVFLRGTAVGAQNSSGFCAARALGWTYLSVRAHAASTKAVDQRVWFQLSKTADVAAVVLYAIGAKNSKNHQDIHTQPSLAMLTAPGELKAVSAA
jgi:hypothetical protein